VRGVRQSRRGWGRIMNGVALAGRSILVVEDELLVALEIESCLQAAGASMLVARRLREAQALAERPDVSAAVLDFGLGHGDTGALCEHLNARGIPFVVYTGYPQLGEACHKNHRAETR